MYVCGRMALRNWGVVMKNYRGIVYHQDGPAAMSKHFNEGRVICKALFTFCFQ